MMFTVVPTIFILVGGFVLLMYPKEARDKSAMIKLQEKLELSKSTNSQESIDDPWCPGNSVQPIVSDAPSPSGLVSYLWPSQLQAALRSDVGVDYSVLKWAPIQGVLMSSVWLVPGIILVVLGWDTLSSPEG